MLAHVDLGSDVTGRRSLTRALGALVGTAAGTVLLAGCGSASVTSPPTGVDGLLVPTPSARPADFVSGIDNPWLAWSPGATFSYERVGVATGPQGTVTVTVGTGTTEVAGIAATTVTTQDSDVARAVLTDWFAEDRGGNVWWLGRDGQWEAGVDGAEAGLLITAEPRTGDGFRLALLAGVVEDRGLVTEAPAEDALFRAQTIEVRTDLDPGVLESRTYVEGRGLTRVVTTEAPGSTVLELTD